MIYEIDVQDAPARFAELIETIDAGYGVLIRRGDEIIARLAPEWSFHEKAAEEPEENLTPEERQAKETFEMFQHDIEDSF